MKRVLNSDDFRAALDVLQERTGARILYGKIDTDEDRKEAIFKNFNTPDDPDGESTYAYLKKTPEHGWTIVSSSL